MGEVKCLPRLWWWRYSIIQTLSHCVCHLSKCLNNAPTVCVYSCLREVILCLIYCSWLQTWIGSWTRLRQWQNHWERRGCLSARNLSLTAPVWGECHQLSECWGEIYIVRHTAVFFFSYIACNSIMSQNIMLIIHKRVNSKCWREINVTITQIFLKGAIQYLTLSRCEV